jgi:hypothetical protein
MATEPTTPHALWRRAALARTSGANLAILANMEAEDDWNHGRPGLPTISGSRRSDVVQRMDQLGIWLASKDDTVLVSTTPDPAFVRYLRERGLYEGRFLSADSGGPELRGFRRASLISLGHSGAALAPMGNTLGTEAIAHAGSLPIASPSADLSARVNAKTFSQRLCDRLGIPRPRSVSTSNLGELRNSLRELMTDVPKLCVKESLGVSGRGIITLDSLPAAERLLRMLAKQHGEDDQLEFVVEEWIEDATDLNYQVLIDESGGVRPIGLRSSHVLRGVHQGHRFPTRLDSDTAAELEQHGSAIARSLRDDEGYFGVVGLDALLTSSGALYPCLEINARLNMSTFQNRIVEEYVPTGSAAEFFFVRLPESAPGEFGWYEEQLRPLLYRSGDDRGVIVMNHATTGSVGDRRLYVATIGSDEQDASTCRQAVERALDCA